MTPDIHAARELIEREMEHLAAAIDGDSVKGMMILPVFTMLTVALDLLNKAIAFDSGSVPHERR